MEEKKSEATTPLPLDPFTTPKAQAEDTIRIICISDTHSKHPSMPPLPPCDILIHAGDFTNLGSLEDIKSFNSYLGTVESKYNIVIAGNHELLLDEQPSEKKSEKIPYISPEIYIETAREAEKLLSNCIYLSDSGVTLYKYNIYGSAYQPYNGGWAFNLPYHSQLIDKWAQIPMNTDILVTHTPPYGVGDGSFLSKGKILHIGCQNLMDAVLRIKPILHVFGHVHEGYGVYTLPRLDDTLFVNSAICNYFYKVNNKPIIIDVPMK